MNITWANEERPKNSLQLFVAAFYIDVGTSQNEIPPTVHRAKPSIFVLFVLQKLFNPDHQPKMSVA